MANFTHSVTMTWTRGYGDSLSQTVSLSNIAEDNINILLTTSNANYAIDVEIDPTKVACLVMTTDAANITINTKDSANNAIETINLALNTPLVWFTGCVYDIPIGGVNGNTVVQKLLISNPSTNTNTNYSLRVLRSA